MPKIDSEFQSLIPALSQEELSGLEADIVRDGQATVALIVWNGILLDGHNRFAICTKHGLPFTTTEAPSWIKDRRDARIWIRTTALNRRNLGPVTRAELARGNEKDIGDKNREAAAAGRRLGGETAGRGRPKADSLPQNSSGSCRGAIDRAEQAARAMPPGAERETRSIAAAQAGMSHPTYAAAKVIADKAVPELRAAVDRGDIAVSTGAELTALPPEKQREIAKAGPKAARIAAGAVKREKKSEQRAARAVVAEAAIAQAAIMRPDAKVLHSPICTADVEPLSVDVIITDPPYPQEFLGCFSELSKFALRVLKHGGLCVVMSGQSYLPEVVTRLCEHLSYVWTAAYLTPGGQAVQVWNRKVNTFWKPLLVMASGKPARPDWIGDVCRSDVNDNDKRFHDWGQSESGMRGIVERFSSPGELVCDPFCGAGTTGVVATALGRKFVGIDIDAAACAVATRRLSA